MAARSAEVADEIGVSYGALVTARQRFGISRPRTRTGPIDVDEVRRPLATGESAALDRPSDSPLTDRDRTG
ncbi:MAG: hypothetical protein ABIP17_06875 [Ilumatobacteraceae bacterium]